MPVITKCLEAIWATYFNSSQGGEKTQEGSCITFSYRAELTGNFWGKRQEVGIPEQAEKT